MWERKKFHNCPPDSGDWENLGNVNIGEIVVISEGDDCAELKITPDNNAVATSISGTPDLTLGFPVELGFYPRERVFSQGTSRVIQKECVAFWPKGAEHPSIAIFWSKDNSEEQS